MRLSDIRMRDPFVIEASPGRFVLTGTTDENLWGGPAVGFDCYTSEDLEQWEGPFPAFRPPTGFWSSSQFWAPEIHPHDGRFLLFATFAGTAGGRGTAVLVSDDATGPFVPWSDGPVTPHDLPCLDGTLFIDESGNPWIVYSRGAEGIPGVADPVADGEMWARRLSSDLSEGLGEPELLFTATDAPWARPLRLPEGAEPPPGLILAPDPYFTDGAFLFRSGDGSLLMLWSSFGEEGYAMGIARSAGGIHGPWTHDPAPLWARNGGHGMLLRTSAGRTALVFHAPNDTPNERVMLVEVTIGVHGVSLF